MHAAAGLHHASQMPYYPDGGYAPQQPYGTFGGAFMATASAASAGLGSPKGGVFHRGQRRRINALPVALALFSPWALFAAVFAAMSFSIHYEQPSLTFLVVALGGLMVFGAGLAALSAQRKKVAGDPSYEPTWVGFMFLTLLLAWLLAVAGGGVNFLENMQPFYDITNLNFYPAVDPSVMRGQMLMDAGITVFTPDSRLDLRRSIGFRNMDVYCVAPISKGNSSSDLETLSNYDFWAVGVNCCSGNMPDFRCDQFSNPKAHGGLRLMRDDQRPFFRLAVQQAEAAYNIKAVHPLFFVWMQDPVAEVNSYQDGGFKYFLIGLFSHLALQLFLVASATIVFARLGQL